MELGSSTTAKPKHPLFWGGQEPCAPSWLFQGYPPPPWIKMNHNSQQPHGQQSSNTEGFCASRPYGSWSPRHPKTDKFSGQGMWQPWVSMPL